MAGKITLKCAYCGKLFTTYQSRRKRFCSRECRAHWKEFKPAEKPKKVETLQTSAKDVPAEERQPYANSGDYFFRQYIGKVVKI